MILAMLAGIDEPIQDAVVGFPAHTALKMEQAARAVNMRLRRARRLRTTPEFCEAMRQATANYRACLAPGNIATAIEIRDDKANLAKDRLKAAQYLDGPQPAHAGVTVNVSQNAISPGYVIRLNDPPEPIHGTFIDHNGERDRARSNPHRALGSEQQRQSGQGHR